MNYEQKYKEALERAREFMTNKGVAPNADAFKTAKELTETIFPELKESEDEKIRQTLIHIVKGACNKYGIKYQGKEIGEEKLLAYLEKQGEQKPIDKVEPKFKVGDWVVFNNDHNSVYQVEKIENYEYTLRHILGGSMPLSFSHENMIRVWTIKDAKDGDVLSFDNECSNYHSIGIFKRIASKNEPNGNTYRCYVKYGGFKEKLEIPKNGDELHHCGTSVHPATKEQRDFLFQKMKEAGYEWDAEKKELKKIEQKQSWSEDDEKMCQETIDWFEKKCFPYALESENPARESIKWLKSLKNRVQLKQEWSKEDEKIWVTISNLLWEGYNMSDKKTSWEKIKDWLLPRVKSLKPQNHWKPSEGQMKHLKSISIGWHPSLDDCRILSSLYNDLLKL